MATAVPTKLVVCLSLGFSCVCVCVRVCVRVCVCSSTYIVHHQCELFLVQGVNIAVPFNCFAMCSLLAAACLLMVLRFDCIVCLLRAAVIPCSQLRAVFAFLAVRSFP